MTASNDAAADAANAADPVDAAAPAAGPCPDENALSELVQGLLDDERAADLEAHLDGCAECRRIVSSVGQSSYLAQRIRTRVDADESEPGTISMADPPSVAGKTLPDVEVPPAGTLLAGKYRIERLLGQGGMGVVMAATHVTLGKLVALKLMRRDLAVDPGATQRFVREARAASLLRSEHIVRVIDLDTLDDGSPYIAMEYLEGEDLGAVLARRGPLPAHDAATYIVQVCEAIAEAHAAGIVHRDLKPANLFLTLRADSPCVKVLDFGVSKIIAGGPFADHVASTDTKALVGSPQYMAPEQLISAKLVDPRTDIWALGCILYELVAGETPFGASHALAQVLASILRDEVPPLEQRCPHLPAGFAPIVARCLDKDPARRYQRVDELAAALAPFVSRGMPHTSRPLTGQSPRIATAIGHTPAPAVPTPAPFVPAPVPAAPQNGGRTAPATLSTRRGRWPTAALALVLVAALGIAVYTALGDPPRPAASSSADEPPTPTIRELPVVTPTETPTMTPTMTPIDAHVDESTDNVPTAQPRTSSDTPVDTDTRDRPGQRLEDDLIGPPL
jgi:eukaryotic-like serine/threonine-protein kinase